MPAALEWPTRSRVRVWQYTGRHRVWLSRCRQFRISLCLDYTGSNYVSCVVDALDRWRLVGRNRTLRAAQARCRRYRRVHLRPTVARQGRSQ